MKIFSPRILLYVEGAVVGVMSVYFYARVSGDWLLFALFILAPDLSILGYIAGARTGAVFYNTIHAYVLTALLGGYGLLFAQPLALALSLIWLAHIGFDRLLGFGLKYPTAFKDTHLNRV